ncbi:uncharacterized protein Tco025E_08754 [Trypanosoma conorhini]|uniref:Uncharacterized protein n=1 Tax=Trypanosoma conorhini TaxID=83891 RepID=A0A422N582_9TRYP|nr:uncharacterized protein Tco025E_08754 [Trypanosoma conorhini]RNF00643.1 hypothetical protein Tco025E_08754 [Trypanosoma conorhini]
MWLTCPARIQTISLAHKGAVICRRNMACLRVRRTVAMPAIAVNAVDVSFTSRRGCSSSLRSPETSAKLLELMEAFAEARELIIEAKESVGTVYVAEDLQDAKEQTEKTLTLWKDIQADLELSGDTDALRRLKREHDIKMSQLRAELEDVEHSSSDD